MGENIHYNNNSELIVTIQIIFPVKVHKSSSSAFAIFLTTFIVQL